MAFDDDDDPRSEMDAPRANLDTEAAAEEAMDDGLPDYGLFAAMFGKKGVSSKTIRKGEKDFESHGTRAQANTLESSRKALEEVLGYTRTHRVDSWTRGWYFPDWWRQGVPEGSSDLWLHDRVVVMEHEKGSWMKDLGRTVSGSKDIPGVGRLWLLPEEALYLIERGTVDLWWPDRGIEELLPAGEASGGAPRPGRGPDDYEAGLPLSLEAAYCFLVGDENEAGKTTLPRYQVFAHLKRAGFHVLRAPPEPERRQTQGPEARRGSLLAWLLSLASWATRSRERLYGPLVRPGIYRSYAPIYQQLALLPRHKPLSHASRMAERPRDPFRVHFHVWKPGGAPFSKRAPRPPDFRIAVADTNDSHVPDLEEMTALLESTPPDPPGEELQGPGKLHRRLKHGYRNVLVAVVDSGLVNFMRFGEAVFGEELLFERFDGGGRWGRGGKRGGRGGARGRGRGRGGKSRGS